MTSEKTELESDKATQTKKRDKLDSEKKALSEELARKKQEFNDLASLNDKLNREGHAKLAAQKNKEKENQEILKEIDGTRAEKKAKEQKIKQV